MLEITPISAFDDNYIWMLENPASATFVAVDPGDETPVLAWLAQHGAAALSAIFVTHHHYDHVGGLPELLQRYPGIPVYGPAAVRGVTRAVGEGDRVSVEGLEADFSVLQVPGHTASHIAYYGEDALFCGDTLFAAGCGRVFDGTFEQLSASLLRIAGLPGETRIYCAHEYTLDNLGFAAWVEPESSALRERTRREQARRAAGEPTLPALLQTELETNPFLRSSDAGVRAAAERHAGHPLQSDTEVFIALRQWKDREYD
jgi:hydroxyacylglutathione hydrolase